MSAKNRTFWASGARGTPRVDAPGARTGEGQVKEDEAIENRRVAAVVDRKDIRGVQPFSRSAVHSAPSLLFLSKPKNVIPANAGIPLAGAMT
jgi:hypothetical protein